MLVLGIETSCDETAVGIVEDRLHLRSNVIASSAAMAAEFGGVVPEIAAREHLLKILPVIDQALVEAGCVLSDMDGIAVTRGPGLIGSLLVGVSAAKALALSYDLPLLGVNHLRAHIDVSQLEHGELELPAIALIVSGGHSSIVHVTRDPTELENGGIRFQEMGATLDDAAGEAFDKIARFIGLGYPGGPEIDRLARAGNPAAFSFPRALRGDGTYNFSFSGLKTAVIRELRRMEDANEEFVLEDLAASFQEAIVDIQVEKTIAAAKEKTGVETLILAGGVAANSRLRERMKTVAEDNGMKMLVPSIPLCTDNGAMVAATGSNLLAAGVTTDLSMGATSVLPLARA